MAGREICREYSRKWTSAMAKPDRIESGSILASIYRSREFLRAMKGRSEFDELITFKKLILSH